VIGLDSRVRLAGKARLRFDERSGKHVLLYPERGLELSESAARIAQLCSGGDRTARGIVDELAAAAGDEPRARIESDVMAFLQVLEDRGLLVPA
jgi:coenzyme PQQ biosynthesis protein PqqD